MDKNDSIKYIEKKTYITNPITGEEKLYTVRAAIPEDQKNHAKFLLDAIGYKNSPRFKVGDKIYSTVKERYIVINGVRYDAVRVEDDAFATCKGCAFC